MAHAVPRVLVITGSMGSGKTTILGEASDILASMNIEHAAIDFDALGLAHLGRGAADAVIARNLSCVCGNYAAAGITRFIIAEALENAAALQRIRDAIPGAQMRICRLRASLDVMRQRVAARETGLARSKYISRVIDLERVLDAAGLQDFWMSTDAGPVTATARRLLEEIGWI